MNGQKKACYFGIFDLNHSRTRMVKRGLVRAGYEVFLCQVNPREIHGFRKYFQLINQYRVLRKDHVFDCVVVGFPGYFVVFLAYILSRAPIVFDAYISYFDGIRDRKSYSLYHPKLWFAWCIDFIDGLVSDVVLTINFEYKRFFIENLKVSPKKVEVLHKGADETVFLPNQRKEEISRHSFIVGWWGSFIPLHGVPIIIEAANLLKDRSDINFHIVGGGQLAPSIKKQVEDKNLSKVFLTHFIPQSELIKKVLQFDLVLGIFNPASKSQRCVTNKVYEAMAMGKAIITQDSPANREIFTHKVNAFLVPPGDPQALAQAISLLVQDHQLRSTLAKGAENLFKERFVTEKIEEELVGILVRHNL